MADGDSDTNRQTFTKLGADPFVDIKGSVANLEDGQECAGDKGTMFDGVCMKWYCGCQRAGGVEQDATGFGLRLHGEQSTWKFRCNNQPGFALCQKPGPAE